MWNPPLRGVTAPSTVDRLRTPPISRYVRKMLPQGEQPENPPAQIIVRRVIDYVDVNYAANITLRDVALSLGYSPAHLTNTFSRHTGVPVNAWIIRRRIHAVEQLLREGAAPVAAVCEAVGFNDVCYFTRQFVRNIGTTPGRYRRMLFEVDAHSSRVLGLEPGPPRRRRTLPPCEERSRLFPRLTLEQPTGV
jgi:AraC-like DNA-binding protein